MGWLGVVFMSYETCCVKLGHSNVLRSPKGPLFISGAGGVRVHIGTHGARWVEKTPDSEQDDELNSMLYFLLGATSSRRNTAYSVFIYNGGSILLAFSKDVAMQPKIKSLSSKSGVCPKNEQKVDEKSWRKKSLYNMPLSIYFTRVLPDISGTWGEAPKRANKRSRAEAKVEEARWARVERSCCCLLHTQPQGRRIDPEAAVIRPLIKCQSSSLFLPPPPPPPPLPLALGLVASSPYCTGLECSPRLLSGSSRAEHSGNLPSYPLGRRRDTSHANYRKSVLEALSRDYEYYEGYKRLFRTTTISVDNSGVLKEREDEI
ncbi:hypothetical protein KQX54_004563 [Cotesia glomerata]|uniref:Uncharacterized protein n=1 Tax=Cotesia glomerata TaxID=32391 RepID=A0AAV7I0R1_COTGL|nr:hypothetical protein KQX54_004563 [Cotesia glomerata]